MRTSDPAAPLANVSGGTSPAASAQTPANPANPAAPAAAISSSELPRGNSIDRYVILSPLGRGAMGEVYAAYDPQLDSSRPR
jgi:hypothetical protein